MNNTKFGKTMENVSKHKDTKFVRTEKRRNYWSQNQVIILRSFSQKTCQLQISKLPPISLNKPVYLGLSILELSKKLIYNSWYDYVKPTHGEKAMFCYMDKTFHCSHQKIIFIKTLQQITDDASKGKKAKGTKSVS